MPCLHMNERMCAQLCPTLCNPMDYSLPGSSVHGISQATILEQGAIYSSGVSSRPRDQTHIFCVTCIGRQILYHWAMCGSNLILWRKWKNIKWKAAKKEAPASVVKLTSVCKQYCEEQRSLISIFAHPCTQLQGQKHHLHWWRATQIIS